MAARRRWKVLGALGALVTVATMSLAVPIGTAAAEESYPLQTHMQGGSYFFGNGLYPFSLAVALRVGPTPTPITGGVPGVLVTVTAGGKPLCTAPTGSGPNNAGIARCIWNPLSPGGLQAMLGAPVVVSFAGSYPYGPSSGTLPPFGPAPPAPFPL